MKKIVTKFLIAMLAVCATLACVMGIAACNSSDGGSSGESADYVFMIVYSDGTALDGTAVNNGKVKTQICETGTNGKCITLFQDSIAIYPDKDGKLTLSQSKVNELFGSESDVTVFYFHVLGIEGYASDCEFAVNGKGTYTCKLYTA